MNTLSYYCALVALGSDYLDVTSYELALVLLLMVRWQHNNNAFSFQVNHTIVRFEKWIRWLIIVPLLPWFQTTGMLPLMSLRWCLLLIVWWQHNNNTFSFQVNHTIVCFEKWTRCLIIVPLLPWFQTTWMWPLMSLRWCLLLMVRWQHNNNAFSFQVNHTIVRFEKWTRRLIIVPLLPWFQATCMWPLMSLRWCLLLMVWWQHNNNTFSFQVNHTIVRFEKWIRCLVIVPLLPWFQTTCMWPLMSLRWCLLLMVRWQHNNNTFSFQVNHTIVRFEKWIRRLIIVPLLPWFQTTWMWPLMSLRWYLLLMVRWQHNNNAFSFQVNHTIVRFLMSLRWCLLLMVRWQHNNNAFSFQVNHTIVRFEKWIRCLIIVPLLPWFQTTWMGSLMSLRWCLLLMVRWQHNNNTFSFQVNHTIVRFKKWTRCLIIVPLFLWFQTTWMWPLMSLRWCLLLMVRWQHNNNTFSFQVNHTIVRFEKWIRRLIIVPLLPWFQTTGMLPLMSLRWCLLLIVWWQHNNNTFSFQVNHTIVCFEKWTRCLIIVPLLPWFQTTWMWPLMSLRWCLLLMVRWQHNNNAFSFQVNHTIVRFEKWIRCLVIVPLLPWFQTTCMWPLMSLRWCLLLMVRWQHNNNTFSFQVNHTIVRFEKWIRRLIIVPLLPWFQTTWMWPLMSLRWYLLLMVRWQHNNNAFSFQVNHTIVRFLMSLRWCLLLMVRWQHNNNAFSFQVNHTIVRFEKWIRCLIIVPLLPWFQTTWMGSLMSLRWCLLLMVRWQHNNNTFSFQVNHTIVRFKKWTRCLIIVPLFLWFQTTWMWPLMSLRWCLLLMVRWQHNNNTFSFQVNYTIVRYEKWIRCLIILLLLPWFQTTWMWPLMSLRWCLLLMVRWQHNNNAFSFQVNHTIVRFEKWIRWLIIVPLLPWFQTTGMLPLMSLRWCLLLIVWWQHNNNTFSFQVNHTIARFEKWTRCLIIVPLLPWFQTTWMWPLMSLRWCLLLMVRWQHNNNAFSFQVNHTIVRFEKWTRRLIIVPLLPWFQTTCMWPLMSLRWCLLLMVRWQHNNNTFFFQVNHTIVRFEKWIRCLIIVPLLPWFQTTGMWPVMSLRWCLLLMVRWQHNNNAFSFQVNHTIVRFEKWIRWLIIVPLLPWFQTTGMWPLMSLRWCLLLMVWWQHNNNTFSFQVNHTIVRFEKWTRCLIIVPLLPWFKTTWMWPLMSLRWCLLLMVRWQHNNNTFSFQVNHTIVRFEKWIRCLVIVLLLPWFQTTWMWPLMSLRWCLLLMVRWQHNNNAFSFQVNHTIVRFEKWIRWLIIVPLLPWFQTTGMWPLMSLRWCLLLMVWWQHNNNTFSFQVNHTIVRFEKWTRCLIIVPLLPWFQTTWMWPLMSLRWCLLLMVRWQHNDNAFSFQLNHTIVRFKKWTRCLFIVALLPWWQFRGWVGGA